MKTIYPVAIMIATVVLLLAPVPGLGQAPALARSDDQVSDRAQAERAERIAQRFERNARQLTVFDREGKLMHTVGARDVRRTEILTGPDTLGGDQERLRSRNQ